MTLKTTCLAGVLLLCTAPAYADEACHLAKVAGVDLGFDPAGGVDVPMTISGQTVNLLIDTGGVDSMLTETTVRTLGLVTGKLTYAHVTMFGGTKIDSFATGRDINFGGLTAARLQFLVTPDKILRSGEGGTLAPDILRAYDDDFDFANARFNLISPEHCPGKVVYWTNGDYAQIDLRTDDSGHISVPLLLDGKEVRADIDTGSSRSILDLDTAESLFGFDAKSPALTEYKGGFAKAYRYPIKTLTFGGVQVTNPDIVIVPDDVSRMQGGPKFILGMGVLRQLHIYLAYHEKKMYVTAASAH